MSNPVTIRGWLDLVEGHLSTIAANSTTIAAALSAPLTGAPLASGQHTIAQMLASALFVPQSEFSDDAYNGVSQLFSQHIGSPEEDRFRSYVEGVFLASANLNGIARAVGGFPFDEATPRMWENLSSVRFLLIEILGSLQTDDYPSPIRNPIQDILSVISSMSGEVSETRVSSGEATVLLQRLINCSPCGDALPDAPTLCENVGGFLRSESWTEYYDSAADATFYFANMEGNFTIGQFTFTSTSVQPFAGAPQVQGFVATKAGAAPRDVRYCLEWAGNSQLNEGLFMTPLGNAVLVNGGVTLNSPAPNNTADTDQVFGPAQNANSTYYVYTTRNPIGGSLPDTSRVFITPQLLS